MFSDLTYIVKERYLCNSRANNNTKVFEMLGIDNPRKFCQSHYGYEISGGLSTTSWPEYERQDYAAATRVVKALFALAHTQGFRYSVNGIIPDLNLPTDPGKSETPVTPSPEYPGQVRAVPGPSTAKLATLTPPSPGSKVPLRVRYNDKIEWGDYHYQVKSRYLENCKDRQNNGWLFQDQNLLIGDAIKFCSDQYGYAAKKHGVISWPEYNTNDYTAASRLVAAITTRALQKGWVVKINGDPVTITPWQPLAGNEIGHVSPNPSGQPIAGIHIGGISTITPSPVTTGRCIAGRKPKLKIVTDNRNINQPKCIHD
jgi:hypothetical protein